MYNFIATPANDEQQKQAGRLKEVFARDLVWIHSQWKKKKNN